MTRETIVKMMIISEVDAKPWQKFDFDLLIAQWGAILLIYKGKYL